MSTVTWLDIETSHDAIEALTDLYITLEDDPTAEPMSMNAEEAQASRTAAKADIERWRDTRHEVSKLAMIAVLRAETIGHNPSPEQVEGYTKFMSGTDGVHIYRDHMRDEQGRMVNAGLLTSDIVDQVAGAIHSRLVGA
ncbi:Uncharacterised protein [Mycobacteroides abscessus subsp. abscessus]|uniref:hypothetical protein n=1 Tax=Mycobacteroides abscessus TaxID=36809 RepID=UPI0009A753CF|nr:hypothetical protein [Mycobacteroides abscessus]SLJ23355.1 Uncharacterised protein [Mycobacteroides abscessus subsp. abscessus]